MDMPRPTAAHERLNKFIGKWRGEEKMSPSPWDPKGGIATGIIENRLSLDGFAVIQEYTQMRDDAVSFRGHGVITYDGQEKCYLMHWFDSMGTPPNVFKGNFEGEILKLSNRFPGGFTRTAWNLGTEKKYSFKMEMSADGTTWNRLMDGDYKREG